MSAAGVGRLVVRKVHNNNVVLAVDEHGRSTVVTGTGVGFGARRGTLVDPASVEAIYVPAADRSAEAAAGLLAEIPLPVVTSARAVIASAQEALGIEHPETLLLPVADHLHQALRRTQEGMEVDIPLVWEVSQLYPRELAAGERALEIVTERTGVQLPAAEATAIALHFVSATFSRALISRTVQMTQSLTSVFEEIERYRGAPLDRRSHAASRFATHLRHLFVRLLEDRSVVAPPPSVRAAIEGDLPEIHAVAQRIGAELSRTWRSTVTPDEVAYIGLHVYRLLAESTNERC